MQQYSCSGYLSLLFLFLSLDCSANRNQLVVELPHINKNWRLHRNNGQKYKEERKKHHQVHVIPYAATHERDQRYCVGACCCWCCRYFDCFSLLFSNGWLSTFRIVRNMKPYNAYTVYTVCSMRCIDVWEVFRSFKDQEIFMAARFYTHPISLYIVLFWLYLFKFKIK